MPSWSACATCCRRRRRSGRGRRLPAAASSPRPRADLEGAMRADLPYADSRLTVTLPADTRRLSSEAAGALPPLADLEGAVREALAAPLGLPRLSELARPNARVTIAFDDHTTGSFGPIRPVTIRAVLDELAAAGVSRSRVRLVCANALHRM